jgi:hypothetical protein
LESRLNSSHEVPMYGDSQHSLLVL